MQLKKDSGLMVYLGVYQTWVLFQSFRDRLSKENQPIAAAPLVPGGNPAPVVPGGPEFCLARLVGRGRLCGGSVSVTPSRDFILVSIFFHTFSIYFQV